MAEMYLIDIPIYRTPVKHSRGRSIIATMLAYKKYEQ